MLNKVEDNPDRQRYSSRYYDCKGLLNASCGFQPGTGVVHDWQDPDFTYQPSNRSFFGHQAMADTFGRMLIGGRPATEAIRCRNVLQPRNLRWAPRRERTTMRYFCRIGTRGSGLHIIGQMWVRMRTLCLSHRLGGLLE